MGQAGDDRNTEALDAAQFGHLYKLADQPGVNLKGSVIQKDLAEQMQTASDALEFEVAAQRYADLSDQDYGVAILNNCKYGHWIADGVLDLNQDVASNLVNFDNELEKPPESSWYKFW